MSTCLVGWSLATAAFSDVRSFIRQPWGQYTAFTLLCMLVMFLGIIDTMCDTYPVPQTASCPKQSADSHGAWALPRMIAALGPHFLTQGWPSFRFLTVSQSILEYLTICLSMD